MTRAKKNGCCLLNWHFSDSFGQAYKKKCKNIRKPNNLKVFGNKKPKGPK
jgi:hypothetical protein